MEVLLTKDLELNLLFEVLEFLSVAGERELFRIVLIKTFPQITTMDALEEVLDLSAEYYRRLDLDTMETAILRIKDSKDSMESKLKASQKILSLTS